MILVVNGADKIVTEIQNGRVSFSLLFRRLLLPRELRSRFGLGIPLRASGASRYWLPIFFLLGSLNIAFVVSLCTDHIPKLLMADSLPFFVYFLQLLGALFSKPKHTQLLLHGILVGV